MDRTRRALLGGLGLAGLGLLSGGCDGSAHRVGCRNPPVDEERVDDIRHARALAVGRVSLAAMRDEVAVLELRDEARREAGPGRERPDRDVTDHGARRFIHDERSLRVDRASAAA